MSFSDDSKFIRIIQYAKLGVIYIRV